MFLKYINIIYSRKKKLNFFFLFPVLGIESSGVLLLSYIPSSFFILFWDQVQLNCPGRPLRSESKPPESLGLSQSLGYGIIIPNYSSEQYPELTTVINNLICITISSVWNRYKEIFTSTLINFTIHPESLFW